MLLNTKHCQHDLDLASPRTPSVSGSPRPSARSGVNFVPPNSDRNLELTSERVVDGVEFLRRVNAGKCPEMRETVVVVGGGDVAMDACRVAKLLPGCKHVKVIYRRGHGRRTMAVRSAMWQVSSGWWLTISTASPRSLRNRSSNSSVSWRSAGALRGQDAPAQHRTGGLALGEAGHCCGHRHPAGGDAGGVAGRLRHFAAADAPSALNRPPAPLEFLRLTPLTARCRAGGPTMEAARRTTYGSPARTSPGDRVHGASTPRSVEPSRSRCVLRRA